MNHIIFSEAPSNINAFNELLSRCTKDNMTPLKIKLSLPKEVQNGADLAFSSFLEAVAYPMQSYPLDKEQKQLLFKNFARLYPSEFPVSSSKTKESQIALSIFKRMTTLPDPPVGFVPFDRLFTDVEPLETYKLHSEKDVEERKERREQNVKDFLKDVNTLPADQRIDCLIALLELLKLERSMFQLSWSFLEAIDANYRDIQKNSCGKSYILLDPCHATFIQEESLKNEESANELAYEDCAINLKMRSLEKKMIQFADATLKGEIAKIPKPFRWLLQKSSKKPRNLNMDWKGICFISEIQLRKKRREIVAKDFSESLAKIYHMYTDSKSYVYTDSKLIVNFGFILFALIHSRKENRKKQEEEFSASLIELQFESNLYHFCRVYGQYAEQQQQFYEEIYAALQAVKNSEKEKLSNKKTPTPKKIEIEGKLPEFELRPFEFKFEIVDDQIFDEIGSHAKKPANIKKKEGKESSGDESEGVQTDEELFEALPSLREASSLSYAKRVTRWFEAEKMHPLNSNDFPDYTTCNFDYQQEMIACHAFSTTVDLYIEKYAAKTSRTNKYGEEETTYILPGQMEKGGKTIRGAFTYCRNASGIFYHRFFTRSSYDKVVQEINQKTFLNLDFPPLSGKAEEKKEGGITLSSLSSTEESISQHAYLGVIKIVNKQDGSILTLIPANENDTE